MIRVQKVKGVCSAIQISDLDYFKSLRFRNKSIVANYIRKNVEKEHSDAFLEMNVKIVYFTLNTSRFWHWFTPFQLLKTYVGNNDKDTPARLYCITFPKGMIHY